METKKIQKQRVIMSVDAETDGLWGSHFAIGAVIYDEKGKELRRFCGKSDVAPSNEWVQENVVPFLDDIPSLGYVLLDEFADFYNEAREQYEVTVLWHMGYVVEGFLFRTLVEDGYIGEWDAPYTPIEVSSYLSMAGYAPDSVEDYLKIKGIKVEGEGSRHNPIFDCIAAYKAYIELKEEIKNMNKKMNFVNCTPHPIKLNSGEVFEASGTVARVSQEFSEFDAHGMCRASYGESVNLPEPVPDTFYIVSLIVLDACKGKRTDLVAPATGHPECVRDEKGFIVSVPGFIR
ncbi:MAG: hypothetical protein ACTTKI_00510 [Tannerella sp.]|uniref:hypothetical protein n=1 Tax=Tannerella sp. TaxID=2382127 RepID=UPI003FA25B4C